MSKSNPIFLTDIAQYEAELELEETLCGGHELPDTPQPRSTPSYSDNFDKISDNRAAEIDALLEKSNTDIHRSAGKLTSSGITVGASTVPEYAFAKFGFGELFAGFSKGHGPAWPKERELKALMHRKAQAESAPGGESLAALEPRLSASFANLVDLENISNGYPTRIPDLVFGHARRIEAVIGRTLWVGSDDILQRVGARLESGQTAVLSRAQKNQQPTLGTYGLFAVGCHRALKQGDALVTKWVREHFQDQVSRHSGERTDVVTQLASGDLARFIGQLRDKHRNPLAHGCESSPQDGATYLAFCDFAYGTESLRQWLDIGVSPYLHVPQKFGWVSFLVMARKRDE